MSTLRRTLGTTDLTLLVIGNVIGSGIFIVPSVVLRQSGGSVPVASAVWLVAGVLSLMGALSYGELSSMDRKSGGLYAFIRDGFGPFPAFLYGWTLFFVIGAGTIATLAVAGRAKHVSNARLIRSRSVSLWTSRRSANEPLIVAISGLLSR